MTLEDGHQVVRIEGLGEVLVRAADPAVSRVVIRPVFWNAGTKGAPSGDEAERVAGAPGSFTGQLWLMAAGPYVVHVTATGPRGSGTAVKRFSLTFRTISVAQMRRRLELAGFRIDAVLGDYDGGPFDERADVWIILARKR